MARAGLYTDATSDVDKRYNLVARHTVIPAFNSRVCYLTSTLCSLRLGALAPDIPLRGSVLRMYRDNCYLPCTGQVH
ncbi:hypothetical protein J6590_030786 [Homalodisca vitripennis]|nr:hypothetical protein J6590_030786 [Homalodisca vitripennis]